MEALYTPPTYELDAFNCPYCGAYATQYWFAALVHRGGFNPVTNVKVNSCGRCNGWTIWRDGQMLYPAGGGAPFAHVDMPEEVKTIFEEARAIFSTSPRASAALLRLCIELLATHLGAEGKNLSEKIGWLVAHKNLHEDVQQSLDAVRVVGNHTLHPGSIDVTGNDNAETALALFDAVNHIVDETITRPKKRQALWAKVPDAQKQSAAERDAKMREKATSI